MSASMAGPGAGPSTCSSPRSPCSSRCRATPTTAPRLAASWWTASSACAWTATATPCRRKIVALADVYGAEKVARALADALCYHAFSSDYIANILEQRERRLPEPGPLHLARKQDLLDLELPDPDLSVYGADEEQPAEGDHADEAEA